MSGRTVILDLGLELGVLVPALEYTTDFNSVSSSPWPQCFQRVSPQLAAPHTHTLSEHVWKEARIGSQVQI